MDKMAVAYLFIIIISIRIIFRFCCLSFENKSKIRKSQNEMSVLVKS